MNLYPFLVFAHVLGTVGIAAAMAAEAVSLRRVSRAPTLADDTRAFVLSLRLGVVGMLTTLASGVWMMVAAWGPVPWVVASVIGFVGMATLGAALSLRNVPRLGSDAAHVAPTLAVSFSGRLAIGIAILTLMCFKPGAAGSALLLALGALAGLGSHYVLRALVPQTSTAGAR